MASTKRNAHQPPVNNENYCIAFKMLEERFGNPQLLIHKHMTKLLSLEVVPSIYDLKRQFHKMVKYTETIRWQFAHELSQCV